MRAIALINSAAGTVSAGQGQWDRAGLVKALADAGIEAEVQMVSGGQIQAAAEAAVRTKIDLLIAGGGDGTISTVAGVLVDKPLPLGVLPLGTLNHFAKDLGIPTEIDSAIRVLGEQNIESIDVGQVNDRVFINNSSLGMYPQLVIDRDSQQRNYGMSKWPAMFLAMIKVLRRFPLVEVTVTTDEKTVRRKTPLVFIGNNRYQLDLFQIGKRTCLKQGELSLYVATAQTRWGVFKLCLHALLGTLRQSRDFETVCVGSCQIGSRRHRMHVAVDGEVIRGSPPLDYRIRAGALRVCVPRKPETLSLPVNDEQVGDVAVQPV